MGQSEVFKGHRAIHSALVATAQRESSYTPGVHPRACASQGPCKNLATFAKTCEETCKTCSSTHSICL